MIGWLILIALLVVLALPLLREIQRKPMSQSTRRDAPGQFVTLSQGTTHYRWIGPIRGPVAVCVHGLTTPSFVWDGLAAGLTAMGYRVLVYDLYGRGYSDRPKGAQDAGFFLTQLNDLLEDQQVEDDITLLGYSMGGAIATAFTAQQPGRIRQLVLLASAGLRPAPTGLIGFIARTPLIGDWLMFALYPSQQRKGVEAERDLPSSVENISDLVLNELNHTGYVPAVLASLRGILAEPMDDRIRAIHSANVPVLAVWGRDDTVIPLTSMGRLAELNRTARQEVIEGAGHGLTYTHTRAVLDAMRETLRDGLI
ncbi:MAG: alpha/beta fold hydrolase [Sedimentitalea sp.]